MLTWSSEYFIKDTTTEIVMSNNCPSFYFLPSLSFFFNWRIIALQYCIVFCHTITWISHRYTNVPSLLNPASISRSIPLYPTPLGGPRALDWAPFVTKQIPICYLFYTWYCMVLYVSKLFSKFVPCSPSPTVSTSLSYMSASPLHADSLPPKP